MSNFGYTKQMIGNRPHVCAWCGQVIPLRESHLQFKGRWGKSWQNWRMHNECYDAYRTGDIDDCFDPWVNDRPKKVEAK